MGSFAQQESPNPRGGRAFSSNNPPGNGLCKTSSTLRRHLRPEHGPQGRIFAYLPKGYGKNAGHQYPVVYHLHGGRPGSEKKSISLSSFVDRAIASKVIPPTIYVFPNGGPMSWYNYPQKRNGLARAFAGEPIPHVDATYRTFGTVAAGPRVFPGWPGNHLIMFKYPGLFGSVAPGGSGYEPEMRIRDNR